MEKARKTAGYYDKQSTTYDRLYRSYLDHTHQKMMSHLWLSEGDRILDVSAGTGLLADRIIQKFGPFEELVLNDPANRMLAQAVNRLRDCQDFISYTNYYAEELLFERNSFDHIICLNSFHYYVDQKRVLSHFNHLLKPGGMLWMLDWNRAGFFIINSKLIDWFSPMNINTRSLIEVKKMLSEQNFEIHEKEEWSFRLWNFFFIKAVKFE